jgi:hypothetical protein
MQGQMVEDRSETREKLRSRGHFHSSRDTLSILIIANVHPTHSLAEADAAHTFVAP